jgi:hypothetical protein
MKVIGKIAQSKIEQDWTIKAIYNDDVMVGFTMYF